MGQQFLNTNTHSLWAKKSSHFPPRYTLHCLLSHHHRDHPAHALPKPTWQGQASTWWLWWCSQGEPSREALPLKLTEVGTQDLLNYLTRQTPHSVHFLTSSHFSKNWHSCTALHCTSEQCLDCFLLWLRFWEHCPQLISKLLSPQQMGV